MSDDIRTRVEYVLCMEADTEEKARGEAAETDFNDWEQFPSEEYHVELVGVIIGKEELTEARVQNRNASFNGR